MNILVKGMEMPDCCRTCCFMINCEACEGIECWCAALQEYIGYESQVPTEFRLGDCPLIEIPAHGRLIDADALLARFEKEEKAADEHGRDFSFSFKNGGENCTEWWPVQQMLMDAPTIIPAEEGQHMSVSKWAYDPAKCDGDYCPGDCDFCAKREAAEPEKKVMTNGDCIRLMDDNALAVWYCRDRPCESCRFLKTEDGVQSCTIFSWLSAEAVP